MDQNELPKYTVPVIKKDQPDDSYKFQPPPQPTGDYPFHLDMKTIVKPNDQKMIFHMVGDTGNTRANDSQLKVVEAMIEQYDDEFDRPQFLYHLGDIVYNYGEAEGYEAQFFKPYADYPAAIMAISGNHDGDVNPGVAPYKSLDAFAAVFCDKSPQTVSFGNHAARKSMVQPNVYWTLKSPLANIIGLYSNVTKYGVITDEQKQWFIQELIAADKERCEKALIVCLHHAPYSADVNHGSSLLMIEFLNDAFAMANVRPDVVFSGHVHNYQRFCKKYADGMITPYIVAGCGGYDQLHPVVSIDDEWFTPDHPLLQGVSLENYCDTNHGFLKIIIEKRHNGMFLKGEFFAIDEDEEASDPTEPVLADIFEIRIGQPEDGIRSYCC